MKGNITNLQCEISFSGSSERIKVIKSLFIDFLYKVEALDEIVDVRIWQEEENEK